MLKVKKCITNCLLHHAYIQLDNSDASSLPFEFDFWIKRLQYRVMREEIELKK